MALTILAEQQDGLLLLTLNRPDKRNALNTEMYLALTLAFQQAALDESVHVVLLQGQQECFTAGNDLADFMVDRIFQHAGIAKRTTRPWRA